MSNFHDQGNMSLRNHSVPIVQVSMSQCVENNLQHDAHLLGYCMSKDTRLSRKNDIYTISSTESLTSNTCAYGIASSIPLVLLSGWFLASGLALGETYMSLTQFESWILGRVRDTCKGDHDTFAFSQDSNVITHAERVSFKGHSYASSNTSFLPYSLFYWHNDMDVNVSLLTSI